MPAPLVDTVSLVNHFLIAMPAMTDPNFSKTLTFVCEHNADGALGIIVNRPTDLTLSELFERVDIELEAGEPQHRYGGLPVYFGGPVQTDRGFVLHQPAGEWQSTIIVNSDIALTSSRDILQCMGKNAEPSQVMVALGYAGWSAGQLEWELSQNAWLTVPAEPSVIFNLPPESRLSAAMRILGVDPLNLSDVAGHA